MSQTTQTVKKAFVPKVSQDSQNSQSSNSSDSQKFPPQTSLSLWKPNKDKKGAAAMIAYSDSKRCFFLKMLPENSAGNGPKFLNDQAISAKLGLTDVGAFLSVLTGRVAGLGRQNDKGYWSGLYHESPAGVSIINLSRMNNDGGYYLSLSSKKDNNESKYNISVTWAEAELLRCLLENYVVDMMKEQSND